MWLNSLLEEVGRISLCEGVADKWSWLPSPDGVFSVNIFYTFLQVPLVSNSDPIFLRVWQAVAPSNVKAFLLRLLLDRIPSKENLRKRKVIQSDGELLCKICCMEIESSDHLAFACSFALDIWLGCYRWLGVQTVLPGSSREHLLQFNFGRSKIQQKGLFTVWLATLWSI